MNIKPLPIPLLALTAALLGLCGCAAPAPSGGMVASPAGDLTKHPEAVSVTVTGGAEVSSNSASQVANPDFTAALIKSIKQSGIFAKIVPGGEPGAVYELQVAIGVLDQPVIGADMTATLEARWKLVRHSNGYVMWDETIKSSHTAGAREAFTGIERMRLAIDGAAKDNIRQGITRLGTLALP